MRIRLIFLILLSISFTSLKANDKNTLCISVHSKDGSNVLYALEEKPKITFTDVYLIITTKGVEVSYPLKDMARLTYENKEVSGIKKIHDDKASFAHDGESIIFPCLKAKDIVSLYAINGALIFKKIISTDGEYTFSLSSIKSGVYIVSINELTCKIVKK